MAIQTLPFTVEVVTQRSALLDACEVRAAGYGHHMPQVRGRYRAPEPIDTQPGTTVLVAYDKASGEAVGTARIQTTTHGGTTPVESCIELPENMQEDARAEITKLAALPSADSLVKLAIWKASYLYCLANQVRWLFMCARSRGLVRQYRRLGAKPFFSDERMLPLSYAADIPHQVLLFDVVDVQRSASADNHALFNFVFTTLHPDLHLFPRTPLAPEPTISEPWTYAPTKSFRPNLRSIPAGIPAHVARNTC